MTNMLPADHFMSLAVEAAAPYVGRTAPNPAVGCVLVREGEVLATGAHIRAGEDHAEIAALRHTGMRAEGADAYVTLEPCVHSHRDPHCGRALVEAGVRRVFVGSIDPDSRMRGRGVDWLRSEGLEVTTGIFQDACDRLIRPFRRAVEEGIPTVTLKLATTLDGRLADDSGQERRVTGEEASARVHEMRDGHDALLVGIGTVLADDPRLTTRLEGREGRQPLRAVVDSRLRISSDAVVLQELEKAPTLILTCVSSDAPQIVSLRDAGVDVAVVEENADGRVGLRNALAELVARNCHTVLCEGGATLSASLLRERLVHRLAWFLAPKLLGAPHILALQETIAVPGLNRPIVLSDISVELVGNDVLVEGDVVYPEEGS